MRRRPLRRPHPASAAGSAPIKKIQFHAIDALDSLFRREGKEVAMTVLRGTDVLNVRLKLRRLI